MKRFLITMLTVITMCIAAQAQYIEGTPQRLERRGGHLYTENGSRIDIDIARSIMNEESFQLYSSGRKLYRAGVIVSSIGGGFGAVGIVLFATSLGSLNTANQYPVIVRRQCQTEESRRMLCSRNPCLSLRSVHRHPAERHRTRHPLLTTSLRTF